jgi:flagellar hook-length control protein FliK
MPTGTAAPTAEADTSDTPSRITAFQRDGNGPASAEIRARANLGEVVEPTGADAASAALTAARDATDRLTERGAAAGAEPGSASFPIDARPFAGATPDPALAMLAVLSGGVRADAERKTRHADDSLPPASLAVGALGAAAQMRSIDAPTPPSATASVSTPLTDADFHEALGLQVSLLARDGIQQAELRLNPADMGPVSVQITMNGDQARVDFGADLAQTRQIIEAGWAELAASLQEAGFTLSGGGVSEHARNRQEPAELSSRGADRRATAEDAPVVAVVAARPRAGAALDLYA